MKISTLWRYPVKSMMGEELNGTNISLGGVVGDRAYALIDTSNNNVISAKNPKKWPNFFDFHAAYSTPNDTASAVWINLPNGEVINSQQADANLSLIHI